MRVVYSVAHEAHAPETFISRGVVSPSPETRSQSLINDCSPEARTALAALMPVVQTLCFSAASPCVVSRDEFVPPRQKNRRRWCRATEVQVAERYLELYEPGALERLVVEIPDLAA